MSWIDSSRSGFGRSIDRSLDLFGKKAHKPTTRTHSTTEQHKHTNKQNELKTKQALVAYSFNQTVVQVGIPCCEYKNKTAQKKKCANSPIGPLDGRQIHAVFVCSGNSRWTGAAIMWPFRFATTRIYHETQSLPFGNCKWWYQPSVFVEL